MNLRPPGYEQTMPHPRHDSVFHSSQVSPQARVVMAPVTASVPDRPDPSRSEIWSEGQTITAMVPPTGVLPSALSGPPVPRRLPPPGVSRLHIWLHPHRPPPHPQSLVKRLGRTQPFGRHELTTHLQVHHGAPGAGWGPTSPSAHRLGHARHPNAQEPGKHEVTCGSRH